MRDVRDSQGKRFTHAAGHAAHGTPRPRSHAPGATHASPSPRRAVTAGARRAHATVEVSDEEGISTIRAGQGARVTTRHNADQAARRARRNAEERYFERHPEARGTAVGPERSRKNVVLLVVLAVLALVIVFLVGRCVTVALAPAPDEGASEQTFGDQGLTSEGPQEVERDPESEVAFADGSVSYQGSTYFLATQEDGSWGVSETDPYGASETLFLLEGTPAALARWTNTILVPENRDGTWDVVCYVIAGHTGGASYLVGEDGSPVQGNGEVSSVSIEGSVMHVTTTDGAVSDVQLS
ncbi:hypothetical protein [Olsenella profusa]|uniref:Uncharacterized protein n=1 Tax=Olsenella profusa TaxID=138595 RepID=A0ABS2F308_9ACTN|nr:hypothetical protein [Olsenella profusa]MBM6775376.1 hypothetical protein [Olsenella profusa]